MIPIINIPLLQSQKCTESDSFYGIALAGLQSYPFYIIQVSYLLEETKSYNNIALIQILSLGKSLIVLCLSPFADVLRITSYHYQYDGFILQR